MIKLLVFDLDGTLADTRKDLAASVNAALSQLGSSPLPLESIIAFLGDGARNLLMRSIMAAGDGQASNAEIESGVEAFLEHYREHCLAETRAYPGLTESLGRLGRFRKAVLTNKHGEPARKILAGLGLAPHFTQVLGGDNPYGLKPDPEAMRKIMETEGVAPQETLLIGDGVQDLRTARRAGSHFLGFLGGMAPRAMMLAEHPEAVFEDMRGLVEAIAAVEARPAGPETKA